MRSSIAGTLESRVACYRSIDSLLNNAVVKCSGSTNRRHASRNLRPRLIFSHVRHLSLQTLFAILISMDWQAIQSGHPSQNRLIKGAHMALSLRRCDFTALVHINLIGLYNVCYRIRWQCRSSASKNIYSP